MEVTTGWMEPLLSRFVDNMNRLVWAKISSIDRDTMQVHFDNSNPGSIGGFKFNMDFQWIGIDWYEKGMNRSTPKWSPKKSPTSLGGTFAISKSFFTNLGMFDPDFGIWGGEDVELSFKVWMCGGEIEFVPCSFVAHLYKYHKYTVSIHI